MSPTAPHILRRLSAFAVLAAAFAIPTSAHAVVEAPTVDVEVRKAKVTIAGADDLGRGPVRLRLSGERLDGSRTVAVVALDPGVEPDDLDDPRLHDVTATRVASPTARASEHLVQELERFGRLVAGGRVSADEGHTTTVVLAAGEYAVLDVSAENGGLAAFVVGDDHNGARVPRSDVTIGLRDKGFYLPSLLPADGILRISNQGDLIHQATAYRLKRGVSDRQAVRAAIRGRDLYAYGTSTVLTGPVSGHTVNRVEVSLRRGRYLVVSEYTPFTMDAPSDISRGLVAITRVR